MRLHLHKWMPGVLRATVVDETPYAQLYRAEQLETCARCGEERARRVSMLRGVHSMPTERWVPKNWETGHTKVVASEFGLYIVPQEPPPVPPGPPRRAD